MNPEIIIISIIGIFATGLIFFRPDLGLIILTIMIYTRFSDVMVNFHGLPSVAKLFIPLLFFVIFARWMSFGETPKNWEHAVAVLVGYGFLGILSLLYADDPSRTESALIDFAKDAIILIIFVVLIQRVGDLKLVVWTLIACGVFLGTISTYQYLSGSFDNAFWGFGQASYASVVSGRGGGDFRAGGPELGANAFGRYLLLVIPLALNQFWNEEKSNLKFLAGWAFVATLFALIFTFSRGAFLSLVVALLYYFIRRPPRLQISVAIVLVGFIVYSFLPPQYIERLTELADFFPGGDEFAIEANISFRGRLSENIVAWQMFLDNPINGVGLNNYPYHYQSYSQSLGLDPRGEERSPHNMYLEILAELGTLGILWFVFLQWMSFRGLKQAHRDFLSMNMHSEAHLCLAMEAVLIGFLITGIFLHVSHIRFFWMVYGFALSIRHVARNEIIEEERQDTFASRIKAQRAAL